MPVTPPELMKNSHFVRYQTTWEKNPASIVFIPLAELYREQGFLEEAIVVCRKGLEFHPQSIGGRLALARIYFDKEELAQAGRFASEVLQEIPGHKEARALLARVTRASGLPVEREETLTLFETCTMAEIYASQGEIGTAREILRKILARDPTHERAGRLEKKLCGS